MTAEEIESIVKIGGSTIAAGASLVTLLKAYHKSQPALKAGVRSDIELLKLIDQADPNYKLVKDRIDATIRRLYKSPESEPGILGLRIYNPVTLVFGVALSLGFGYWTYHLYNAGQQWWWYALTGFFAVGGVGNVLISFDPSSAKARDSEKATDERSKGEVGATP